MVGHWRGDLDKVNSPPIKITKDMVHDSGGQDVVVIKAKTIGPPERRTVM